MGARSVAAMVLVRAAASVAWEVVAVAAFTPGATLADRAKAAVATLWATHACWATVVAAATGPEREGWSWLGLGQHRRGKVEGPPWLGRRRHTCGWGPTVQRREGAAGRWLA